MLSNNKCSKEFWLLVLLYKGNLFFILSRRMDTKTQYNITPKINTVNRQHAKFIMFQKQVGKFLVIRITHHSTQTPGAYYRRLYWIKGLLLCKSICVCDYRHSFFLIPSVL